MEAEVTTAPRVGISSMVLKEGKVLLGRRVGSSGAGSWATPGGHLEYGETVEGGAARELLEETGLIAKTLHRGPYSNNLIEHHHYVTLFVFITKFEGEPICLEPQKCEGWEWFDWDDLPEPLIPGMQTLVKEFGLEKLKQFSL
ncbi:MAG: Phosphatase NudJ [Chlamydiae bacterium]|nr:Phosphatase NudJ [Chlamydiota bacterium]